MGIDAEMIVRIPGGNYTDETLRQVAGRMVATVGMGSFSIIHPEEWDWYGPKGRHALSLVTSTAGERLEDAECLDAEEVAALRAVEAARPIHQQDGPAMIAEPGEQFVEVNFATRYYGIGYERGNWPAIRATAEFLEHAFPGATVYYGGDSSGVLAKPFDAAARAKINDHYLAHGHAPYRGYQGPWDKSDRPGCDFCGGMKMNDIGGSAEVTFYSCDGCGHKMVGNGGGINKIATIFEALTPQERREDNFAKWNAATERLREKACANQTTN